MGFTRLAFTLARMVLPLECDILRILPYLKLKLISRIAAHDSMVTGKPQWLTLSMVYGGREAIL